MKKLKSPHILLAVSTNNVREMLKNIEYIIDEKAIEAIKGEIDKNVKELFNLGKEHFDFAKRSHKNDWRQRISRFYYGAYNVRRSIQLHYNGVYNTDISDHQKVGELPASFPNDDIYSCYIEDLRDDRNMADYDHTASEGDLLHTQDEYEQSVDDFIKDTYDFMKKRGVSL